MQITITQLEIELAIRGYIGSIINTKEDAQVEISFRAGRGEDGLTATIDITSKAVPLGVAVAAVQANKSQILGDTKVRAMDTGPTDTVYKGALAEPELNSIGTDAAEELVVAVEPQAAPKSLFGGLKKPVNTPSAE